MFQHLRACLWLLIVTVVLCCVVYPLVLLGIGKAVFPKQAEGSLVQRGGKDVGSLLIAQPFTGDEYFQPRPSAASPSYNAAASGATNWAANNYQLRDRVARQLATIVKYQSGPKKGQLVGPDIETWFQKDRYRGQLGIVSQWAAAHSTIAQNWIKADKLNTAYVADWQNAHAKDVADWVKDNPGTLEPKPEDLAGPFFASFSKDHPGMFPSIVEHKSADGKSSEKKVEPVKEGSDIQAAFFDMWLEEENPQAGLTPVPADMVMASGSGLDPHITLDNALFQLDRVADGWAKKTNGDQARLHGEIEQIVRQHSFAPMGGLIGVPLVNVLEVNLALEDQFQKSAKAEK
ncbi:MAG: potassium-transporting ATPase subunit C [Thermoguttaceae bacterium]|jgi:K+-transporting ATPase ATPase C chain